MKKLITQIEKARHSRFNLWIINRVLAKMVPFNAPHGFKIVAVGEDSLTTFAPYKKRNFNHVKGIHACGIATIAEFAAGMMLIREFNVTKYRTIMSKLETTYHYQAKKDLRGVSSITKKQKWRPWETVKIKTSYQI